MNFINETFIGVCALVIICAYPVWRNIADWADMAVGMLVFSVTIFVVSALTGVALSGHLVRALAIAGALNGVFSVAAIVLSRHVLKDWALAYRTGKRVSAVTNAHVMYPSFSRQPTRGPTNEDAVKALVMDLTPGGNIVGSYSVYHLWMASFVRRAFFKVTFGSQENFRTWKNKGIRA